LSSAVKKTPEPLTSERRSLLNELTTKGVRITAQRRALLEIIQNATEHLDAAAILEEAQKREPNIDQIDGSIDRGPSWT